MRKIIGVRREKTVRHCRTVFICRRVPSPLVPEVTRYEPEHQREDDAHDDRRDDRDVRHGIFSLDDDVARQLAGTPSREREDQPYDEEPGADENEDLGDLWHEIFMQWSSTSITSFHHRSQTPDFLTFTGIPRSV